MKNSDPSLLEEYREKVQRYLQAEWDTQFQLPYDRYFSNITNDCFEFKDSVNNCAADLMQGKDI